MGRFLLPGTREPETPEPLPVMQTTVERTGLTAAVAPVTIFTAGRAGFYRATIVAFCTTGGDAITLTVNIIHTDRTSGSSVTRPVIGTASDPAVAALSMSATGRTSGTYTFEAAANTNVQYSSTLSGARAASVHAYKIFIERLED